MQICSPIKITPFGTKTTCKQRGICFVIEQHINAAGGPALNKGSVEYGSCANMTHLYVSTRLISSFPIILNLGCARCSVSNMTYLL